jgi:EAL domain-containing protein (putative c-di-GMP-specific phosphodiesterase class I)
VTGFSPRSRPPCAARYATAIWSPWPRPCGATTTAPGGVVVRPAPQRLRSPRFVAEIGDVLATHGPAPHDLVVDVPDDAGREPEVAARLEALRALGVRVAVHDFRIGYADFRTVPVDLLRIDVPREPCDVPVAEAVIRLGRAPGLATLVGDVEVPADATDLRRLLRAGGQERLRG